jgi:hypothetical protein
MHIYKQGKPVFDMKEITSFFPVARKVVVIEAFSSSVLDILSSPSDNDAFLIREMSIDMVF